MAEGLLEGALGGEEDKPEMEAPVPLAGVEAFAAAIAAKLTGNDPEVARYTSAFLKKQAQLPGDSGGASQGRTRGPPAFPARSGP